MHTTNIVTIMFGKPITAPVLVPVEHKSTPACINEPFMVNGECLKVTAMSFNTPHGTVLVDDVDRVNVEVLGSALGTHALFPKGASIVFVQVLDKNNIKARLWQRGEGEIIFSLEAACVAVISAMMLQKILTNEADVTMGDHTFHVKWDRGLDNVYLTGASDLLSN